MRILNKWPPLARRSRSVQVNDLNWLPRSVFLIPGGQKEAMAERFALLAVHGASIEGRVNLSGGWAGSDFLDPDGDGVALDHIRCRDAA